MTTADQKLPEEKLTSQELADRLKQAAQQLGFVLAGVAPAVEPAGFGRFSEWLTAGYAGQMHYLAERQQAYAHPGHVLDGVRSILMLAIPYRTVDPRPPQPGEGRVSRYAWGDDYHDLIWSKLDQLCDQLEQLVPGSRNRGVVDTAPLLEREFAQLAGLGWIGKNTLLLNQQHGSWFFLAALLTDVELAADEPSTTDHCGTCRACLDACPTGAFVAPYVLDATRCISYLTIELREAIPRSLRTGMGDWLFGCDVCQDVCPWNTNSRAESLPPSPEPTFQPRAETNPLELTALFELTEEDFRQRFRKTPLWRARRRGVLRNAAIVLGNQQAASAVSALTRGLNDEEALVRGACAWALGQYRQAELVVAIREKLYARQQVETDAAVLEEIRSALANVTE
ncbi:MAG: tRNA epoxyqueuosine(34) reductase QueG [Planctomycetota bacterium]|nr:tRNA epoxyqueuosine(34) reductase QueG [Planctomycetota bacterium]